MLSQLLRELQQFLFLVLQHLCPEYLLLNLSHPCQHLVQHVFLARHLQRLALLPNQSLQFLAFSLGLLEVADGPAHGVPLQLVEGVPHLPQQVLLQLGICLPELVEYLFNLCYKRCAVIPQQFLCVLLRFLDNCNCKNHIILQVDLLDGFLRESPGDVVLHLALELLLLLQQRVPLLPQRVVFLLEAVDLGNPQVLLLELHQGTLRVLDVVVQYVEHLVDFEQLDVQVLQVPQRSLTASSIAWASP